MKKLTITIAIILVNLSMFSQIDPIKVNKALKASPFSTTPKFSIDSVKRDLTNGLRDNPALYPSTSRAGGLDSNKRLIYFMHGLGGGEDSWLGSYDRLTSKYEYWPERVNYNGNQRDFKNASNAAHKDMDLLLTSYKSRYFNDSSVLRRLKPYIIGHSQGGLIGRDIDMKHDSAITMDKGTIDRTNRRHWGMITFGTPHAGSYFAVNQDQLANLGGELFKRLSKNEVRSYLVGKALKYPLFKGTILGVMLDIEDVIDFIGVDLTPKMFKLAAKGNLDPITKQYGPKSTTYVNTTLNYSNPNFAKGLFYGVEEDPLIWRVSYYMISPDASDSVRFGNFGANDDGDLAIDMEDIRLKIIARTKLNQGHLNYHKSRLSNFRRLNAGNFYVLSLFYAPFISDAKKKIAGYRQIVNSNNNAAIFLSNTNLLYKVILGAYADSNTVTTLAGYDCQRTVVVSRRNLWKPGYSVLATVIDPTYRVGVGCSCGTDYTQNYKINMRWRKREVSFTSTPVYKTDFIETPSDGVVLKPSQRAFPGCLDWYKRSMDEIWDETTQTFIKVPETVNHMQMRNCKQTEAAMRRIYNGDGTMPYFFHLEKK